MQCNGAIVGDEQIAIDLWKPDAVSQAKIHFLTHLHADHIKGLSKTWSRPIYTSLLNCKLAPEFIHGLNPQLLMPLEINKETKLSLTR